MSLARRDHVHAELTRLLSERGPLHVTPTRVAHYLTNDFNDQIAATYRHQQTGIATQGRAAIVTAGPPGVGKSTALATFNTTGCTSKQREFWWPSSRGAR